jgi:hypothetical protein
MGIPKTNKKFNPNDEICKTLLEEIGQRPRDFVVTRSEILYFKEFLMNKTQTQLIYWIFRLKYKRGLGLGSRKRDLVVDIMLTKLRDARADTTVKGSQEAILWTSNIRAVLNDMEDNFASGEERKEKDASVTAAKETIEAYIYKLQL